MSRSCSSQIPSLALGVLPRKIRDARFSRFSYASPFQRFAAGTLAYTAEGQET